MSFTIRALMHVCMVYLHISNMRLIDFVLNNICLDLQFNLMYNADIRILHMGDEWWILHFMLRKSSYHNKMN